MTNDANVKRWSDMFVLYRSTANGLTSEQLAHHDLVTGEGKRKAERQKASIDRWNQDTFGPNKPKDELGDRLYDHQPPPAAYLGSGSADQRQDYHQLSYDDPSSFQAHQYQGHQSSVSHPPHEGQSPARRYDPYDLSPAYLGSYPDESADPTTQFDGYPAAGSGHVHGSYDSSSYQQRYQPVKPAGGVGADSDYSKGDQNRGFADQNSMCNDPSSKSYAHQHEQPPQDPNPFDFGVQQSYPSHSRHQASQNGRRKNSQPGGGKPPTQPVLSSHEEDQWGQPHPAGSGWDSGNISQNPSADVMHGGHMGASHQSESSQWRAPVEEGQARRGGGGRGRGRGQQKPYRPDVAQQKQSVQHQVSGTRIQGC